MEGKVMSKSMSRKRILDEYVPGEHDFPVTPSHVEYCGGFDVIYNLSNRLAAQLSFDYLRGAEVEKTDPIMRRIPMENIRSICLFPSKL